MTTPHTTDLVRCDRPFCGKFVPATEAVWDAEYDLAYCSIDCEQSEDEFRECLEPLQTTYKRLDGIYNLSLCCGDLISDWGVCANCGDWAV